MHHQPNHDALVAALRGALPYLRLYQGRTFVVKVGGAGLDDPANVKSVADQVALLHCLGVRMVLVHGGGDQINRTSEQLGLTVQKVDGRRVTDAETLEVTTMVLNGAVRTSLLAAFREAGVKAVGISGVDAGLIRAVRRPPRATTSGSTVDFGMVGDIESVDEGVLNKLLDEGLIAVVSPLSADDAGTVLNINADSVAARLAAALGAEKLILVTDAPGLLEDPEDPGSLVVSTDLEGLDELEAGGSFVGGVLPKVAAIRTALAAGVPRAHVISRRVRDSILTEVFTNMGAGTLVTGNEAASPSTLQTAGAA